MIKKRYAFTMLELLFVIVIMGILGKFGVEFLARAYDNFIFAKINNDLQAKSASTVEFIAKKLEYRIKKSARSINTSSGAINYIMGGISDPTADVLEWIGTDVENFRGSSVPLWSGIIDLSSSTGTTLVSPGSDFATLDTNILTLSDGTTGLDDAAVYFLDTRLKPSGTDYFGFYSATNQTLHPIQSTAVNNEINASLSGQEVSEYYQLTWTAYAIRMENYDATTKMGDLYLYYNYQPWKGETYSADGTKVLLAKDINSFRFRSAGSLIKIQVCAKSDLTEEYALCKEKTVF